MDERDLIKHLRETLQVELLASETYPQYAQQVTDPDVKSKLEEFGRDSDRHFAIVLDLLDQWGARPNRITELLVSGSAWMKGLSDLGRQGRYGLLLNLQDLLTAEYRDRLDWQIMQTIAESYGDQDLKDAVAEVLPDEEEHVSWLENKVKEISSEIFGEHA